MQGNSTFALCCISKRYAFENVTVVFFKKRHQVFKALRCRGAARASPEQFSRGQRRGQGGRLAATRQGGVKLRNGIQP